MPQADLIDELERPIEKAAPHFALGEIEMPGIQIELPAHRLIYVEGDSADFLFYVKAGCACTFRCDCAGQRSIDAFHLPKEVFGLEAGFRRRWSAETLTPCQIVRCERHRLLRLVEREPRAAAAIVAWLLTQQEQVSLRFARLAHAHGPKRLMAFLTDLAARSDRTSSVDLEMSRADIADYLGFSSETVSRIFTRLRNDGVIHIDGRHVVWSRWGSPDS